MPNLYNYVVVDKKHLFDINWDEVNQECSSFRNTRDGDIILSYAGEQPRFMFRIAGSVNGLEEYTEEEMHEFL